MMRAEAAKNLALERLNRLVAKGYTVRWGETHGQDNLRLEHPSPDRSSPPLHRPERR